MGRSFGKRRVRARPRSPVQNIIRAAVIAVLVTVTACGSGGRGAPTSSAASGSGPTVGKEAPDFSLFDQSVTPDGSRGSVGGWSARPTDGDGPEDTPCVMHGR
jgi:hypothetical protein